MGGPAEASTAAGGTARPPPDGEGSGVSPRQASVSLHAASARNKASTGEARMDPTLEHVAGDRAGGARLRAPRAAVIASATELSRKDRRDHHGGTEIRR